MGQVSPFKRLVPAALFFGFLLYSFFREVGYSREDLGIGTDGPWIVGVLFLLFIIIGIGAMAYVRITVIAEGREWEALKSAFPDSTSSGAVRYATSGTLRLGELESAPIQLTLSREGVRLLKRSQLPDKEDGAFIPWTRVKEVVVQEPRRLRKCRSLKDRQKLAACLEAELTISRGDFPPFSIRVPWRDEFKSELPRRVTFNQSWHWPSISDFAYH